MNEKRKYDSTVARIAGNIRQQLAQKERDDLDQLGRAQTFRAILENIERSYASPQAGDTSESRP